MLVKLVGSFSDPGFVFCTVLRIWAIGTTANLSDVLVLDRVHLLLTHVIAFLMDDRILLPLHGLLDDLGLLHLHSVYDLLDVLVHNLFTSSLLDRVVRQS